MVKLVSDSVKPVVLEPRFTCKNVTLMLSRSFDLPGEPVTGFTMKLNPDLLIEYCDDRVCMFICLSACITGKSHGRISPDFCACYLWLFYLKTGNAQRIAALSKEDRAIGCDFDFCKKTHKIHC